MKSKTALVTGPRRPLAKPRRSDPRDGWLHEPPSTQSAASRAGCECFAGLHPLA
jgi:hypothetical protein